MKFKNSKSATHNFFHSFMSIGYIKSGRLTVNVLINLYDLKFEPKATFDFIKKSILRIGARIKETNELLNDVLNWLPDHFASHKCDLTKLGGLEIAL